MRRALVALVVAACGAPPAPRVVVAPPVAVAPPAPRPVAPVVHATKIRTVEGFSEYRLPNGLQIILLADPSASKITVDIAYFVGSRHEGYGEAGMAHLLEHMMFKGTARHRNVWKLISDRGAGGNATTFIDCTKYFETFAATADNLDWALDLESDRMTNATISADDLAAEFSVVRNELEQRGNNAIATLHERVLRAAYLWHNYGKSVLGSPTDIERVPATALHAFYATYYQPDNAALIIAGKLDEAQTIAAVERWFGGIPRPARALPTTYTVEPPQDGERRVTVSGNGGITAVELGYHGPAGTTAEYVAAAAAMDMLARDPTGRLYGKLVATKLATSLAWYARQWHDPALLTFTAIARDGKDADRIEAIMAAEIEGLGNSPLDAQALERWRLEQLHGMAHEVWDPAQTAIDLGEWASLGDWRARFAFRDAVAAVTLADVTRAARRYFLASNRTVGRYVPAGDPVRTPASGPPDPAAFVANVREGGALDVGEAFTSTLANIDARTTRGQLPGGIATALLPKKTRGGRVTIRLALHWGDAASLQGKATVAGMVGVLAMRGTKHHAYQELVDRQEALESSISISTGASGLTLSIDTVRAHVGEAIALATEMLTEPAFSAHELDLVRQAEITSLEYRLHDPDALSAVRFQQLAAPWPAADPRATRSPADEIAALKALTRADVARFYADFAGAGHGELVAIGDFDPAAITTGIGALTARWTSHARYAPLVQTKLFAPPATRVSIDVHDKPNAVLRLGHDFALRDTDPDYPALVMAQQILGGDNGARLWTRLREHEGLSYTVRSWLWAGSQDAAGGFGGMAIVAPENLAKAIASYLDEVRRLASMPIDPAELARAQRNWLDARNLALADDANVVNILAGQLYLQRDMAFAQALRAKIAAVTVADVERVARAYLSADRLIVVDASDHAKAAAAAAPVAPGR